MDDDLYRDEYGGVNSLVNRNPVKKASILDRIKGGIKAAPSMVKQNIDARMEQRRLEKQAYDEVYRKERISALQEKAKKDAVAKVSKPGGLGGLVSQEGASVARTARGSVDYLFGPGPSGNASAPQGMNLAGMASLFGSQQAVKGKKQPASDPLGSLFAPPVKQPRQPKKQGSRGVHVHIHKR